MKDIKLKIVPTDFSKINNNCIWCPTFQLIWNDLKNEVVGKDITFLNDVNNEMVKDLNKESFNELMLNNDYYYKNYGYMTLNLKKEIEDGIWNKFMEKSDILNQFRFTKNSKEYFFYSMLVRNFTFKNPFDILSNNTFGIKEDSDSELGNNIKVLFYNDYNNYAVKLLTTSSDEIILYKGKRAKNFKDTYNLIVKESKEDNFSRQDTITIANLNFKVESKYKELTNKPFLDSNGVSHIINDIIQTISFNLDNTGGKVKSEAGMSVRFAYINYGKHFDFSDNFVLFLKEKSKDYPYLAINISNIEEFR